METLKDHPAWNELRQAVAELSTVSHARGTDFEAKGARDSSESIGGRRPPGTDREYPDRSEVDAWRESHYSHTPDYFRAEASRVRTVVELERLVVLARAAVTAWRRMPLPPGGEPASMADPQWKRWVIEGNWTATQIVNRYGCSRQYVYQLRNTDRHIEPPKKTEY